MTRTTRWPRLLALLLVTALLLPLLACGTDDGGDDDAGTTEPALSTATTASDAATTAPAAQATATTAEVAASPSAGDDEEVTLRLGVFMTPAELETFEAGLDGIRARHPNWTIALEQTPQDGIAEKMNAQIAAEDLPDVVQVQGLFAQGWIRQEVFSDLTTFSGDAAFDVGDFWSGALDQFTWNDALYGIPTTVAPDMLYFNTAMFDAAGLAYPTDDWTFEDLREAALALTLDAEGHNASDPDFDPANVVQWGFNTVPSNIWGRHFLLPFGADPCVNEDCTEVAWSSPASVEALQWWADLAQSGAAPYDPYSGNQTGVPGDPFSAGLAAMGFNGYFVIGQLNATEAFPYDVVQPPAGDDGTRATPLSTTGWAIPTTSEHQAAAWQLIQELTSAEFLTEFWAAPGHAVPSRRSASESILDPDAAPANRQAILDALEYATVFRPFTASAFEAYGRTAELFTLLMKGDLTVADGAAQIDAAANEVLAKDRE